MAVLKYKVQRATNLFNCYMKNTENVFPTQTINATDALS